MAKSINDLLNSIKSNPYYSPTHCPWHHDNYCLVLTTNHDNKRFHCLYDRSSQKWMSYNSSNSCDIPEYFHDLIVLNKRLGSEFVVPFVIHIREQMGYTIGLYELKAGSYTAKILKPQHLFETFFTFIVILSEVCHLYGGNRPLMNRLKFIYNERHPVLVDVGKRNNEEREKIKSYNTFSRKKWETFLDKRTTKDVLHYVRVCHPEFFIKKINSPCILNENLRFSDETHNLICKSRKKSIREILTEYKDIFLNLKDKVEIQLKQHNK